MGSESAVDLVKAIDAEWAKMDLEAMRKFYSDTCVFEWNDGDQFQGFEAFAEKLSKDTLDYSWKMTMPTHLGRGFMPDLTRSGPWKETQSKRR